MAYRVLLSETAAKYLRHVERVARKRIIEGLHVLEMDPFRSRSGADIKRLEGTSPLKHRLRIGRYRAVFVVEGSDVKVIDVFSRGRGYR